MSIAAFNLFLGCHESDRSDCFHRPLLCESRLRDISHRLLGSRHFQQAGVDTDGSSRISGHVLDVDALGASFLIRSY